MAKERKFASEQEAWDFLAETHQNECVDNQRLAYLDDEAAVDQYCKQQEGGCCGNIDLECEIAGRKAMIGCNYGH